MSKGIFIIGTDTDVGKTFVTAGITYALRKNCYNACSFKSVQSGGILEENKIISGDTQFVKNICEIDEDYNIMNPYCLKEAVSPHLAAKMEGVSIKVDKIIDSYKNLEKKYDYIIAEGSGGIVVPIIDNKYFIYDLIKDLNLPVVIVAGSGVGTINHTILTVNFAKEKGLDIKGIIINGYTKKFYEDDNIETIKNITGLEIISVINKVDLDQDDSIEAVKNEYERSLMINQLLKIF